MRTPGASPTLARLTLAALAVFVTVSSWTALAPASPGAKGKRRWPPPPPPGQPADVAPTEGGIAVLRAPAAERILLREATFQMGSTDADFAEALAACRLEPARDACKEDRFASEQAAHEVLLSSYWIDRTEVTVLAYDRCVAAGACTRPPYAAGGARFDRPEYPVTLVVWNDARRYCEWSGGRLPTEAEWERAARGLGGRRYPWGNVYNPFLSNHGRFGVDDLDARDGFLELGPVGSFREGRTPEGLDDMAGNAAEWVADWWAPAYPEASQVNPKGPDLGDYRVVRGGGYGSARPWLRGAARERMAPNERLPWIGFRCARDAR